MPSKKEIKQKRYADLSSSFRSKLVMYDRVMKKKVMEKEEIKALTPGSVFKMLKFVCEERNKALQGADKEIAK